jgi:hypothetical protein
MKLCAALVLFSLIFAVGCGASTEPTDSGTAADAGTPTDAGSNADAGTDAGTTMLPDAGGPSTLTGTIGSLGAALPIVSSWVINNSGETLVYLSSATLTCATLQASRWLGSQPSGSQVVEIVIKGSPSAGRQVNVPLGEVNYASGGKSSSYEKVAASGSILFTVGAAASAVQGTVSATYSDGTSISGTFNADYCANGQNY